MIWDGYAFKRSAIMFMIESPLELSIPTQSAQHRKPSLQVIVPYTNIYSIN